MSSNGGKSLKEFIENKRKNSQIKKENFESKKKFENEEYGIVHITYCLDNYLFESGKYIKLFGKDFYEKNKDKCKIMIAGKEYKMKYKINVRELEEYGINP